MLKEINQITETIYLGNVEAAFDIKKLKELGIRKVLLVLIYKTIKYLLF